jgi:hypothetical protein
MPFHLVDTYISVDIYIPTVLHKVTSLKGTLMALHLVINMRTCNYYVNKQSNQLSIST